MSGCIALCGHVRVDKCVWTSISCYSRHLQCSRFRAVCDDNNANLHADMAHISGLVAAGVVSSPLKYADIVSTTAHKSLRGPHCAMIFYRLVHSTTSFLCVFVQQGCLFGECQRRKKTFNFEAKIDAVVFSGQKSGPHNRTISGECVGSVHPNHVQRWPCVCNTPRPRSVHVKKKVFGNLQTLCSPHDTVIRLLQARESAIEWACEESWFAGGTENHLYLVDLHPLPPVPFTGRTTLVCLYVSPSIVICARSRSSTLSAS